MTAPTSSSSPLPDIAAKADKAAETLARAEKEVHKAIFGQEKVVADSITVLLAGGHGLLVGLPGLAKTRLVETLAKVFSLAPGRVQFTPDLLPSDILGAEVLEEDENGKRHFRFIRGPIFAELLLADEINRASPRTQSALLQAMQEGTITVAGHHHGLPKPFHVFATQNPLEQEGTYPLPEAQLDRFLMQIDVHYPDRAAEAQMLLATTGTTEAKPEAVIAPNELQAIQGLIRHLPVSEGVLNTVLDLVRDARPGAENPTKHAGHIAWGPGPRASQAFIMAARARALLNGNLAPSIADVKALAEPILKHRMALTYSARAEGLTVEEVIADITSHLPA